MDKVCNTYFRVGVCTHFSLSRVCLAFARVAWSLPVGVGGNKNAIVHMWVDEINKSRLFQ